jgi:DNA-binding winged helix-turn-helix (wHTH) protein
VAIEQDKRGVVILSLRIVSLTDPLAHIEFAVPDLFPLGYLSFVGAREGIGKTTVLTGLCWQATRPSGNFLGLKVRQSSVIYVNTDAPDGESRPVRFWLEKHKASFPDGDMDKITVIEPRGAGLNQDDLIEIERIAKEQNASLIVIDSYMGAFMGFDPNRLEQQMQPLSGLVKLASSTGAAVIVTDHLPKRAAGEREGERGILGSVAKTAQARSVHMLTRLDPKDCDGRDVIRWFVQKQSFSHRLEPFGVEVKLEGESNERVTLERCELPNEKQNSGKHRARNAVLEYLEMYAGQTVKREKLLEVAVKLGNVKERQAREALKEAFGALGDRLEIITLPGRGAPKEFRLKPRAKISETECQPATNEENTSDTVLDLWQPENAMNQNPAPLATVEGISYDLE